MPSAACIRTIERYETRHASHRAIVAGFIAQTLMACSAALAICGAALIVGATREVLFATGCGSWHWRAYVIIRRFRFGLWRASAIAVLALGAAILLAVAHPAERGTSVSLAFAATSASVSAMSERVLDDAPLVGTGAGTFAALAPIYREIDDPPPGSVASTAAAAFAIELGKPMLWLIAAATAVVYHRAAESFTAARAQFILSSNGGKLSYHAPALGLRERRLAGNFSELDCRSHAWSCVRAEQESHSALLRPLALLSARQVRSGPAII